jgi:hypothetical protein
VPLARLLGGWRGALIALSRRACVDRGRVGVLERGGEAHVAARAALRGCPWRSRTAWLLVAIFGSMARPTTASTRGSRRVRRAWLERRVGGHLVADEPDGDPVLVRRPVASDRYGRPAAVARRVSSFFAVGGSASSPPRRGVPLGAPGRNRAGRMFALVMTLPLDFRRTRGAVGRSSG